MLYATLKYVCVFAKQNYFTLTNQTILENPTFYSRVYIKNEEASFHYSYLLLINRSNFSIISLCCCSIRSYNSTILSIGLKVG